jgi:hypothetical protein
MAVVIGDDDVLLQISKVLDSDRIDPKKQLHEWPEDGQMNQHAQREQGGEPIHVK